MADFAFSTGVEPVPGYATRTRVSMRGLAAGDTWTIRITSTLSGDITIGKGNVCDRTFSVALKLREKMYLGLGTNFVISGVEGPYLWEEQNAGAASIDFLNQYGQQDSIIGLATFQGRLAVIGTQSIQIWTVDADPANMALEQTLDNTGALGKETVKSLGDMDVIYLDSTGFRSLRAKQTTLNAEVNDIGTPIDLIVRAALLNYDASAACGVVDPTTRQYWCFVNGTIYVLSRHSESKITAWSTFSPTVSIAGVQTAFTPVKFVVHNRQVYVLASNKKIYLYGGTDNNTYDNCQVVIETAWMDLKEPGVGKQGTGMGAAFKGNWKIEVGMDPIAGTLTEVVNQGSTTSPNTTADSTFDIGNLGYSGYGTHFKLKATSGANSTSKKFSKVMLKYQPGGSR